MAQERFDLEQIQASEQERLGRPGYPPGTTYGYPDANPYGYGYGYEEDDEKVYVRRMWRAIRKRKWMIAVLAIITTSIVTVEMFRTKSMYQASATVEIGKENKTLVKSGDVVIQTDESDDMYFVSTAMKTKIRQLESRPLLEEVVAATKLDQNPRFMEVNGKKTIWEALKTMGSKVHGPENYDPQRVSINPSLSLSAGSDERSEEESARLAPYVDVLESNLSAEPLPDTRMLVVSFSHTDSVVAATVANAVSRVFINYSFENKTEKFRDASEWLTRNTRELEAKVQEAEQELASYSRAHNIFSTDGKETLTGEKLSRLHDQATRAETDRILKESLYQEVKSGRVAQLPEAFADPKISALQAKLGELTVQASELDVKYGPKNQRVVEVKQQIAAVQAQIDDGRKSLEDKLKADYERSVRDEGSLKAALERAKGEAVQQNQATIQLNILQQKVATAKDLYKEFLQKTSQAKIESAEQHNNLRLVDPARMPGSPTGPNRLRTIMIGLLVSVLAGAVLALLLEYLDNTVKSVEDVARYAQLPALSVIPCVRGSKSPLLITAANGKKRSGSEPELTANETGEVGGLAPLGRGSAVAEAYRVLRTSVLLSTAGSPPKTILITSAQPGEGKTTTAINTATSLAQLGGSVLLIDCDLRKPSVHKALGLEKSEGLSTYLSRKVDVDELIQRLPVANLSLLQSGPVPPNAAELISSVHMKDLLKTLGEKYDHIVIDSPPLINVTDPVILSTMVDGVVLVVQGGKSTREVVRRARMELATASAKVFGVVLNNVNLKREGYNDYYYDRYYSSYSENRVESGGD
jgi:capsular exopolysaccharide synthesis family protein